jgi:hypothetical protein
MDKVQKNSNPEYYTPSSEPFRMWMNIHVYFNKTSLNRGLIRIHENWPIQKVLSLLQERLETFVLKLEAGVVATTNDGVAVITDYFHSVHHFKHDNF